MNIKYNEIVCPFGCKDKNFEILDGPISTLVGYFGGPENDGNHYTQPIKCLNCNNEFVKEWVPRGNKIWYRRRGEFKILSGKPGCCEEKYELPCECGGWQKHSSSLGGIDGVRNINGVWIPIKPQFWQCQSCLKIAADFKYGWKYITQKLINQTILEAEKLPKPEIKKLNWTVSEEIGTAIFPNNFII